MGILRNVLLVHSFRRKLGLTTNLHSRPHSPSRFFTCFLPGNTLAWTESRAEFMRGASASIIIRINQIMHSLLPACLRNSLTINTFNNTRLFDLHMFIQQRVSLHAFFLEIP